MRRNGPCDATITGPEKHVRINHAMRWIATHMHIQGNRPRSFQQLLQGIRKLTDRQAEV